MTQRPKAPKGRRLPRKSDGKPYFVVQVIDRETGEPLVGEKYRCALTAQQLVEFVRVEANAAQFPPRADCDDIAFQISVVRS